MVRLGTNKNLAHKLTMGADYVIDEHAVAEAMLQRLMRRDVPRSAMLVAGKPGDGPPAAVREDGAGAGPGLA